MPLELPEFVSRDTIMDELFSLHRVVHRYLVARLYGQDPNDIERQKDVHRAFGDLVTEHDRIVGWAQRLMAEHEDGKLI